MTGRWRDSTIRMKMPPMGMQPFARIEWYGWDITENDCWEYKGYIGKDGYGLLKIKGHPTPVHRLSYEHFIGAIPSGLLIRHTCDNRPCINPKHLLTGTISDNMRDRNERNRTARGNKGKGVFSDEEVLKIRADALLIERGKLMRYYEDVAAHHGVHPATIQKLNARTNYTHV